jgi:hypothetical protein
VADILDKKGGRKEETSLPKYKILLPVSQIKGWEEQSVSD